MPELLFTLMKWTAIVVTVAGCLTILGVIAYGIVAAIAVAIDPLLERYSKKRKREWAGYWNEDHTRFTQRIM